MLNPRHMLRMARWARNPPSRKRVMLVFGILAAALVLAGIERFIGWPEALTLPDRPRMNAKPVPGG